MAPPGLDARLGDDRPMRSGPRRRRGRRTGSPGGSGRSAPSCSARARSRAYSATVVAPAGPFASAMTPTPASMSHSIWATYPTMPPEWPTTWWPATVGDREAQAVRRALLVRHPVDHLVEPGGPAAQEMADVPRHVAGGRDDAARRALRDGEGRGREHAAARMPGHVRVRRSWPSASRLRCSRAMCADEADMPSGSSTPRRIELRERKAGAAARARTRVRRSRRSSTRTGFPAPIRSRRPRARRCGPGDDGPGSAPTGSPDRCMRRWRSVIGPYPPLTRNHGTCWASLSSSDSAPSRSS